jgi:two-component system response regulator PilR (NtrC family)
MTLCEDHRITVHAITFPSRQQNRTSVPEERPVSIALESYMEQFEKQAIVHALERIHRNRSVAARDLDITFRSLRYRLKKLNLE